MFSPNMAGFVGTEKEKETRREKHKIENPFSLAELHDDVRESQRRVRACTYESLTRTNADRQQRHRNM